MGSTTARKNILVALAALAIAALVSVCIAAAGNAQTAYADLQGASTQATSLDTQATAKKLTTKGTFTFIGVNGRASITSKAVKGAKYKCSAGTLTIRNCDLARNSSGKTISGKSFKISVAKNCKFYSVGSSGPIRKTASAAISDFKNGYTLSLQVTISGKKATKICFGAW